MDSAAVRFHQFGDPSRVLQLDKIPVAKPGTGQLLLRLLASPIHPSDLGTVFGSYGELPELPAIAGREGIGEIVEKGPGTDSFEIGQRVLFPTGPGAWTEFRLLPSAEVLPVPEQAPTLQAAMAAINPPTAWLLLENFVELEPGDWIIQNAANSAVGHSIIQLCHARGIRSINLVRDPRWFAPLREIGADEVLLADDPDLKERVAAVTDGKGARLGLNSVGGPSVISLIQSLGNRGTLVTFGGMSSEPIRFPTRYLIFNDVRLVGFWLHHWKKTTPKAKQDALMEKILNRIAEGQLHAPIEKTFPLTSFSQAIQQASTGKRSGKILFDQSTSGNSGN
ncbi:MAG TPA: zinc-dependent alcohol dehydrogenase family protein [Opitutales bacterium]|nr:zinc-dependent alcohol dehydrogenase family protein [Opitutales bacterium]